ncbi:MAG: hypothetical protein ACOYLB_16515 [Phototrophicaceae bacterium]
MARRDVSLSQSRVYESKAGVYQDKPILIHRVRIKQDEYVRRFRASLLASLVGGGVLLMLLIPQVASLIPFPLVQLGGMIAAFLFLLVSLGRTFYRFRLVKQRPDEDIQFYDKGFIWRRKNTPDAKYGWNAVKTVRRLYKHTRSGKVRSGHIEWVMRDGQTFRYETHHGDLDHFVQKVEPYANSEIGSRMAHWVRGGQLFKIHPKLGVHPEGILIGEDQLLEWAYLALSVQKDKVEISLRNEDQTLEEVVSVPVWEVINLGGFIELASTTTENYQRKTAYKI